MNQKSKGFSLIEAMITVAIFSYGMIGIAHLMTVSIKSNHNGYMRSQAIFLVSSAIDMMSRNKAAVWNDKYNGEYQGYSDIDGLCQSTECDQNNLAIKDLKQWSNMITGLLPNSSGSITCTAAGASLNNNSSNNFAASEPYNGFCKIVVKWTESNEISGADIQELSWVTKP